MAVTTSGSLGGLLGPIFLLSPLALLALRRRQGRQLLLAAAGLRLHLLQQHQPAIPHRAAPVRRSRHGAGAQRHPCARCWRWWWSTRDLLAGVHPEVLLAVWLAPDQSALSRGASPQECRGILELSRLRLWRRTDGRTGHRARSTVFTYRPIPEAYTSRRILVNYESAANLIDGQIVQEAYDPQLMPTWRLRFAFATAAPCRPSASSRPTPGATSGTSTNCASSTARANSPRNPAWRLTAHPYPWTIQDAFDNSLVTFWRCGETAHPGQFVAGGFPPAGDGRRGTDRSRAQSVRNPAEVRRPDAGRSVGGALGRSARSATPLPPLGLRRAAMAGIAPPRRGLHSQLRGRAGAGDLRANPDLWGIRQVAQFKETKLYQLP